MHNKNRKIKLPAREMFFIEYEYDKSERRYKNCLNTMIKKDIFSLIFNFEHLLSSEIFLSAGFSLCYDKISASI